jgi:phage major head subunit gpT-like protein
MDRDTDNNVFMKNEYYYGTDARGAAFMTLPHLAFGGLAPA